MPVRLVRPSLHASLLSVVALSCAAPSNPRPFECPWAGEGTAIVQVAGNPGGSIQGGTLTCASGARLNGSNNDREAQFCGATFDMSVAIGTADTGTGVRTIAGASLDGNSARVTYTALSSAGNAAYRSEPDGIGTLTINSNFQHAGDNFTGSFQSVHLTRQSCTMPNCDGFPATITLSGSFIATAL